MRGLLPNNAETRLEGWLVSRTFLFGTPLTSFQSGAQTGLRRGLACHMIREKGRGGGAALAPRGAQPVPRIVAHYGYGQKGPSPQLFLGQTRKKRWLSTKTDAEIFQLREMLCRCFGDVT